MFDGYRVVCVTPGGRRRYLSLLAHYLVTENQNLVDEWKIFLNTDDVRDISYIQGLSELHPGYVCVWSGDVPYNRHNPTSTIYQMFPCLMDPKTIYIRLDDDIVYVHPDAVRNLCEFRLRHREPFLVYGNIVNNSICGHVQQRLGAFPAVDGVIGYECLCPTGWADPIFAERLHRRFLCDVENNDLVKYTYGEWWNWECERVSINCMSWLGEDMALFGGVVDSNEEVDLSMTKPRQLGRPTVICGGALVSHYAFYTQRPHMDGTDVLSQYRELVGVPEVT